MDVDIIKRIVQNYEWATIEDIEEVLNFIAKYKMNELGFDIVLETIYDEGGVLKQERTSDGKMQVEIGILPLYNIKEQKSFNLENNDCDEKKEFIELILQTFHELRHAEQTNNIIDNPIFNQENFIMTRELIINEVFPGFIVRYNYELSATEIDAMKTSLLDTVKFFQEMESEITPEEIFQTLEDKELCFLNYDIQKFGDNYETALNYFESIYCNPTGISGYPELLQSLSEKEKNIFYSECYDLHQAYILETNVEEKLNILMEISLILKPELYEKYQLACLKNNKKYKSIDRGI